MKNKVLHITQSAGGVETYILLLMTHIDRSRFDLSLICPRHNGTLFEKASSKGIQVYSVEMNRAISPLRDLLHLIEIARIVRRVDPHVVHVHSSKAGVLGRLVATIMRKPVVYTPNAYAFLGASGLKRIFYLLVERAFRPFTTKILAAGLSEKRRSIRDVGFNHDKVTCVNNATEVHSKIPLDAPCYNERPLVLMVGRLCYQKNPEMFVKTARLVADRISEVHFKIIGGGYQEQHGEMVGDLIASTGMDGHFEILEWMDQKDIYAQISQAVVVVIPSRFDGLPFMALESMALGKTLVGTKVDGVMDAIDDGVTGYLVDLDDTAAMAEHIIQLLENEPLRAKMGREGRRRVEKEFNITENIRQIEQIYEALVRRKDYG